MNENIVALLKCSDCRNSFFYKEGEALVCPKCSSKSIKDVPDEEWEYLREEYRLIFPNLILVPRGAKLQ